MGDMTLTTMCGPSGRRPVARYQLTAPTCSLSVGERVTPKSEKTAAVYVYDFFTVV